MGWKENCMKQPKKNSQQDASRKQSSTEQPVGLKDWAGKTAAQFKDNLNKRVNSKRK